MEKTIKDASDIELKAAAYDAVTQIQFLQNQLNAINQELTYRLQAQKSPPAQEVEVLPRTPLA